jgi:hypothetical protein
VLTMKPFSRSTYYESTEGIAITYQRALKELKRHGITDAESIEAFNAECWQKHTRGMPMLQAYSGISTTISAHHVLNWLGY